MVFPSGTPWLRIVAGVFVKRCIFLPVDAQGKINRSCRAPTGRARPAPLGRTVRPAEMRRGVTPAVAGKEVTTGGGADPVATSRLIVSRSMTYIW